ncbi:MAG: hypothetical protein FWD47_07095 [Treponema sp.]|nr:hypothetical protein [Treponema sp.]
MKKTVFFILLATLIVFNSFGQQARYYLEIWDISNATFTTIVNNDRNNIGSIEDDYFLMRSARGSTLRSKDSGISIDEVRQKLRSVDSNPSTAYLNFINNDIIPKLQELGIRTGWFQNSGRTTTVYFWVRRASQ